MRSEGSSIGFVPTMGALHDGHLALVRRAVRENDVTCVSVFVNPLQFDDPRDFERYPRDLARDARLVESAGAALVFTGTIADFFPEAQQRETIPRRDPGPAALGLEGALRPGHFAGVATIVERLFGIVRPSRAYFGEKDFQQTLVVRDLARSLGYPEIVVCPTSREEDGLARSSRNVLLSKDARARARALHDGLIAARQAWRAGERDPGRLAARLRERLIRRGIELEYAEIRDEARWTSGPPEPPLERPRALVAARIGGVRLIDNLSLSDPVEGVGWKAEQGT